MAKKLMLGKDPKADGKPIVIHGNSHASADEVRWDETAHKWATRNKGN